jgi:Cdc6-like AAA superfamily ATPase
MSPKKLAQKSNYYSLKVREENFCTTTLISVLKAKRKSPKRNVKLLAVAHIYHEICREYNLEIIYRQVLDPLKMLDLAGLIRIRTNKEGITSIVEIGYGENTSEVIENLLYNDPDYAKYKDFIPA